MPRRGSRYRAWSRANIRRLTAGRQGKLKHAPPVLILVGHALACPAWLTDNILALARYYPARRRRHVARHQPVLVHQLVGLARFGVGVLDAHELHGRSEEHTSELQSPMYL